MRRCKKNSAHACSSFSFCSVRLTLSAKFINYLTVFFSYNKSTYNIFYHDFGAGRGAHPYEEFLLKDLEIN